MAQTVILAPGATNATSTDVAVAAGGVATIGIYVATGNVPNRVELVVMQDTPGADVPVGRLDKANPSMVVAGPGTFRVTRTPNTNWPAQIGAFSES